MRSSIAVAASLAAWVLPAGSPSAAETASTEIPRSIGELKRTAVIPLGKTADWVAVTADAVWVGSTGPFAVHRIDPHTNKRVATVALRGEPCAGLATGFGSLWIPLCGKNPGLAKVDLHSNKLISVFEIGPAAPEGGIATSRDSVWLVTDKNGTLARIDPDTGMVRQTVHLPAGSYNPLYSDDRIWVTHADGSELTAVDAVTGAVLAAPRTGPGPRFLTAGAGAVWTLNQGDGSLSRIDTQTKRITRTTALGTPGKGGDIAFGGGMIWTTMRKMPLSVIDGTSGALLCQWAGPGGDSLGIAHGAIWLTDYHAGTVWRIELDDALAHCKVASVGSTAPPAKPAAASFDPASAMSMVMGNHLPTTLVDWSKGARLYEGIGSFHRRIDTRSADAQRYFDQGMRFLWAFNHDESTRSFARALKLDPSCAMCAWGVALTIGPNYNLPMLAEPRAKIAFEATRRARRLAASGPKVDRALIAALGQRYPNARPLDPQTAGPVLAAYAGAMRDVARRYPNDLDVQTLFAESMMNIHAWKLWGADGVPAEGTAEIVATLESVLARNPTHMGAMHYYVHAIEASPHPEKALAAAEGLRGVAPAAGHLEHMPAHILQRVGRYEEAAEANRKGATADIAYMAQTMPPDYYPMYLGHNYQFLAYSAAMEGREGETLDAVRRSRASVSDALLKTMPGVDWYVAELYAAHVRFGKWDAQLAEPPPDPELPGLTGGYLYATAIALAAKNRAPEARQRLTQLETLIEKLPADAPAGQNALRDVLAVARRVAAARISAVEGRTDDALRDLSAAVELEDRLGYDEPADWFFPVRHVLGAELMRAGRSPDAERVYRDNLALHPGDGWALYGLMQALDAQARTAEARAAETEFRQAWRYSTIPISASAF